MEPTVQEGPDGSSLKPVSSLRARFENMQGSSPDASSAPVSASAPAATSVPLSAARNRSPSPKPPPIPDTRPSRLPSTHTTAPTLPNQNSLDTHSRPSIDVPRPPPALPGPSSIAPPPTSSRPPRPPPPLGTKPAKPPAVLIDPPQSPPREHGTSFSLSDAGVHLDPDPSKSHAAAAPPPTRPLRTPTRPTTPNLDPSKSPRSNAVQPPSPPPPRRSSEIRRDRDGKPAPPPVNRAEKPGSRLSNIVDSAPKLEPVFVSTPDRHSPFSSPPTTASSPETEDPPALPSRPAARSLRGPPPATTPTRTNTLPPRASVEPPSHSLHHSLSLAGRRRGPETNGTAKIPASTRPLAEPPALPSRPHTVVEPVNRQPPPPAPPRPPRVGGAPPPSKVEINGESSSQATKRTVSTPTQQFAPPPSRTHGRSMTVDRTSDRMPNEFREPPKKVLASDDHVQSPADAPLNPIQGDTKSVNSFPDASNVNRRPPALATVENSEIHTKHDARMFDVCGPYIATSGAMTRVWNILTGELVLSFAHGEGVRATSVVFKPALDVNGEGGRIWVGTNTGELFEAEVATQTVIGAKVNAHGRYEVMKIFRQFNEMWTLDEGGTLHVWGPSADGLPSLANGPHQTFRLARGHTFSMIVGEELWHATGKDIRIFQPSVDGRAQLQVLIRPLIAEGAGDVVSGTLVRTQPDKVFFGHSDGKISIFSRNDFTCLEVLNISSFKINTLAGVGQYIWAGYLSGRIVVYDTGTTPWTVKKDWPAHKEPVIKMVSDPSSLYWIDRHQVLTLGADSVIRAWDGLLQTDYMETQMKAIDQQYCTFQDLKVLVLTWNAGASTPSSLRQSDSDASFIQNLLQSNSSPDILIFGFQELVDLEDKKATAKRLFKSSSKKKDSNDQERMSHQYRDWRDYLIRSLDDYMPANDLYHLLRTASMVGLFTCIFVKSSIRDRVSNLQSGEVKRGMGGFHGNKGAIVVRFTVDDTSLCFINCHLAAGQGQAHARHEDANIILNANIFRPEMNPDTLIDSFTGGGDGSRVLDHELCLLNGDLNYRIDTMSRDAVVKAVRDNNLSRLLDRDQLLVARRRIHAFALRAFEEMPIQFAPTYKYDVGTDNYDTSEKKRSPAWCDRLLYRGAGRIKQIDYKRHEVRVSDHRPVTGRFKFTVKSISPDDRRRAWEDCKQRFEAFKGTEAYEEKMNYLMNIIGYDATTSKGLIRDREARRARRSPSRHRD